jgi:hypothetical protein
MRPAEKRVKSCYTQVLGTLRRKLQVTPPERKINNKITLKGFPNWATLAVTLNW